MIEAAPKLTFGVSGADWTEGINFSRMREERLAKARAALKRHGIAACVLTRPENIRYATGGRGLDFIDQSRYTLVCEGSDPVLYESHGTLAGIHPWIKPENIRQSFHWANQACGPDAVWDSANGSSFGLATPTHNIHGTSRCVRYGSAYDGAVFHATSNS